LAFTKEEKAQMLSRYEGWLNNSQAVVLLEYQHMTMKDINNLRAKVRDAGGEVHVVKNTIFSRAVKNAGFTADEKVFDGPVAISFAPTDPPMLAKTISDALLKQEIFKVKGGFLGKQSMSAAQVKSLADLPPLPVMRARLLGVLQAPASQLVRTIAEPARSLAGVINAYVEKQQPAAEAAPAAA
jgi:large subunit ribosomal protein L10